MPVDRQSRLPVNCLGTATVCLWATWHFVGRGLRWVHDEEQPPYGGASSATPSPSLKRVRTRHFKQAKEQGIKITGLTSYDYLSATIFDQAGIDFLLVGDSAGNAVFGYDTTLPVTIEDLIPMCRAVVRAAKRALVVADMPFGSYEAGPDDALHTAIRFMKETEAHAVKLEGG